MKLIRVSYTQRGTFGVLLDKDNFPFCLTIERPWKDNKRNVSCIPTGKYKCERVYSPTFGVTFQIMNVKGRSHILFHKGNIMDDSHGCPVLGEEFGFLDGEIAVLSSGRAFSEFKDRLKFIDKFPLEIKDGI